MRYLAYWGLRREQLCDPKLGCPDTEKHNKRNCPLTKLEAAQKSRAGQLLQRALDLISIIKLGVSITLDDMGADELRAMLIIEEENSKLEKEISSRES